MALPPDILRSICLIQPDAIFATKLDFPEDVLVALKLTLLRDRHARGGTLLWTDCLRRVDDDLLSAYFRRHYVAPSASFDIALIPTVRSLVSLNRYDLAAELALQRRSTRLMMEATAELAGRLTVPDWESFMRQLLPVFRNAVVEHRAVVWSALWKRRDVQRLSVFLNLLFEAHERLPEFFDWSGLLQVLRVAAARDSNNVTLLIASLRPTFWDGVALLDALGDSPLLLTVIASVVDLRDMANQFAYQGNIDIVRVVLVYMDRTNIDWNTSDLREAMSPSWGEDDVEEVRRTLASDFPHRFEMSLDA